MKEEEEMKRRKRRKRKEEDDKNLSVLAFWSLQCRRVAQ
jgi:hypothetical protein